MSDDRWIVVPNWDKFQFYGQARQPAWIKVYTELNSSDEWCDLTLAERGLLVTIWLEYARSRRRLRVRQLPLLKGQQSHVSRQLERLNHTGLIEFSGEPDKKRRDLKRKGPVDKSEANRQLLHRALNVAADWRGGPSSDFDDALDALERELHARLPISVRRNLWQEALKRERR
jgi:hypothetical protein